MPTSHCAATSRPVEPSASTAARRAVTSPASGRIVVYRDDLLPRSEQFVLDQVSHLVRYDAVLAGCRSVGRDLGRPSITVLGAARAPRVARLVAFRLLGRAGRARTQLHALRPDLVHAHFGPDAVQAMPLARALGVPLVTTFHGYDVTMTDASLAAHSQRGKTFIRRRPELQRSGAAFIAVSDFVRTRLVEQGYPAERVHRHYIGVDTEVFRPVAATRRRRKIVFIGRLVENKGYLDLVAAVERLAAEMEDLQCVFIGDGPGRQALEEAAARSRCINVAGHLSRADVLRHLQEARVLCAPSRRIASGESEGLNLAAVEAQAAGVPGVVYDTGGLSETVQDGRTGLVVRSGDIVALTQALRRVLVDDDLYTRASAAARDRACDLFDIRRQSVALEEIYDDVLARHQTGVWA
jgi:glycosyltransferase involved in cell wall biosynthesis